MCRFEKQDNYREMHDKINELQKELKEQKHDYEIQLQNLREVIDSLTNPVSRQKIHK